MSLALPLVRSQWQENIPFEKERDWNRVKANGKEKKKNKHFATRDRTANRGQDLVRRSRFFFSFGLQICTT